MTTGRHHSEDPVHRIFAALAATDLHALPWAWSAKRTPTKSSCWLLNRLFHASVLIAGPGVKGLRLANFYRTPPSSDSHAFVCVLRATSAWFSQLVIGNIERFRKPGLSIISPSTPDDLLASDSLEPLDASTKPAFVWIAHRTLQPADCRRIVFYVHGGGFVKGDLAAFHHACGTFSRELQALVAFPLYTLCPEQSLEQTVRELNSSFQTVQRTFPNAETVLMADSAGGLLATLLLKTLHAENVSPPQALVLFSPLLDLDLTSASITQHRARDPIVTPELLRWLCSLAKEGSDPAAISLDWVALSYFPRTYLVASTDEILLDDSKRLESALQRSRVSVARAYWPGMIHAFPILHDDLREAQAAITDVRRWLDEAQPQAATETIP